MGIWVVYPEAMAWNVGGVHSDFNFGERIWRSCPQRTNLNENYEIGPLCATLATWNLHFWTGGPLFEIHFPPAKNLFNTVLANCSISLHKMAAKNASRILKTLLLTFLTRPNGQPGCIVSSIHRHVHMVNRYISYLDANSFFAQHLYQYLLSWNALHNILASKETLLRCKFAYLVCKLCMNWN